MAAVSPGTTQRRSEYHPFTARYGKVNGAIPLAEFVGPICGIDRISFSPNGMKLLCVTNVGYDSYILDGENKYCPYYVDRCEYLPDGTAQAVVRGIEDSETKRLYNGKVIHSAREIKDLVNSPDGRMSAFTAWYGENDANNYYPRIRAGTEILPGCLVFEGHSVVGAVIVRGDKVIREFW